MAFLLVGSDLVVDAFAQFGLQAVGQQRGSELAAVIDCEPEHAQQRHQRGAESRHAPARRSRRRRQLGEVRNQLGKLAAQFKILGNEARVASFAGDRRHPFVLDVAQHEGIGDRPSRQDDRIGGPVDHQLACRGADIGGVHLGADAVVEAGARGRHNTPVTSNMSSRPSP